MNSLVNGWFGSDDGEKKGFVIGMGTAASFVTLYTLIKKLREVPERNLSHLHHLDRRAVRHNSIAGAEGFGSDNNNSINSSNNINGAHGDTAVHDGGPDDTGSVVNGRGASSAVSQASLVIDVPIYRIVLTGGPLGGKSSTMEYIASKVRGMGFLVYLVPEVPTLLLNGGCVYPGIDGNEAQLVTFEANLIELQIQMETSFYKIAKSTRKPCIILYDRGLLDVAAYLPRKLWHSVLNYNEWVRDGMLNVIDRYDLILHLVTAANGAERHYLKQAKETVDQAKALDERIKSSYLGHPHHHIIDNSTDFQLKMERVYQHVHNLIHNNF